MQRDFDPVFKDQLEDDPFANVADLNPNDIHSRLKGDILHTIPLHVLDTYLQIKIKEHPLAT